MLRQDISQVKQDFYDGLYLHSLLQSDTKRRVKLGERDLPRVDTPRKRTEWQIFLDDVCLLCDSSRGGATTTAIAVEQRSTGTTFWVSSDFSNNKGLQPYVVRLLRMIQLGARHSGVQSHHAKDIFKDAVSRSWERVDNYVGRLRTALESLEIVQVTAHEGMTCLMVLWYSGATQAD